MSRGPKAAIITGATGGVGSAVARGLAEDGWLPILGFRPPKRAAVEEIVRAIRSRGGEAEALHLPLEAPAVLSASLDEIRGRGLDVQALVLAASPPPVVASFLKTPTSAFREQLELHVAANHLLLTAVWKTFFRERRGGHVLALLSEAMGPPPTAHLSSYTVGKAALLALLEAALAELGPAGLRATALCPTFTETPMLHAFPPHLLDLARGRSPGNRFLLPSEVADRVVRCLAEPPAEARVAVECVRHG